MTATASLLEFNDVHVHFPIRQGLFKREVGRIRAVNGVSFDIKRGQAFGLVGESGCGKSTVARAALKLEEPTSGSIRYAGEHVSLLVGPAMVKYRRKMQAVFQDPFSSLNPRQKAGQIIAEPIRVLGIETKTARLNEMVADLLTQVGLSPEDADKYPHEFSGGQRQRIAIARAIVTRPDLIVADEAVSALDVSIQAQILELLNQIQRETGVAMIFITHDLRVASQICDEIAVMQKGRVVESGPPSRIFLDPQSSYTRELVAAIPGEERGAKPSH